MKKIGKNYSVPIATVERSSDDASRSKINHGARTMTRKTMKPSLYLTLALIAILSLTGHLATTVANAGSPEKNAFTPDAMPYGPPPPFVPPGAQLAVLEGNPAATSGDYTVRLKMPDGYRIAPHWHPQRENVTVLSGTLKVGMGDRFDETSMAAFPAGSFAYLDPAMHHYAMASGEVVIQVHGMSPLQFNYINPEEDPSRKK
jgi:uncharacterized RmlC-like cupin family protein